MRWIVLGVGVAALLLTAMHAYPGSALVYLLFSSAFLLLLVSAFYRQRTYGYTFLAGFLWLGFWLKTAWHLAWGTGFPEPTGQFTGAPEQWDRVLLVSTVGAAAVMAARMLFHLLEGSKQSLRSEGRDLPQYLRTIRAVHWLLFLVAVAVISFANLHFQIFVIGLKTGTVLAFPLNALITLMLVGGGFAAWMATLLWFEICRKATLIPSLGALFIAGLVITSASLSRGMIVSLLVPIVYALYINAEKVSDLARRRGSLIFLVLGTAVAANFFLVTHLRDGIYFQERAAVAESAEATQMKEPLMPVIHVREKLIGFVNYSIDRWVGIEGMMAVTAYPGLNGDLLSRAVSEPPVKIEPSIYSEIAPWPHAPSDVLNQNVSFMSMPGGLAFLHYSGSLWTVFLMTILIVLALQYLEILIAMLTRNPLLCAAIGWLLAMSFAHFGGAPKSLLPGLAFLLIVLAGLTAMQSKWLDSAVKKAIGRA